MGLKNLVGAGDRVIAGMLPVAVAGIATNVVWPDVYRMALGHSGRIAGIVLLAIGVPLWLWAIGQILVYVPRRRLITTGPYALVLHPIYVFVALLVIPGAGFIVDSWVAFPIALSLYVSTRLFAPREERELAAAFPTEYPAYRAKVLVPWL